MKCPHCQHELELGDDRRVIDSRPGSDGSIRRRRVCGQCKQRFTTLETVTDYARKGVSPDQLVEQERRSTEQFVAEMLCRCARAINCIGMIDKLRATEGSSVTIVCDNPEGDPNNAVEVCGEWTQWNDKRFTGDSLESALNAAVRAMEQNMKPIGGLLMNSPGGDTELME